MDHNKYLARALELAEEAFNLGSVPIGAIIANDKGEIIAEGYNEIKITNDPTAHREVLCMRKANIKIITKYHPEPTYLYTTLEPCFACGFFITRTNIKNVIWALNDPYKGGIEFLKNTEQLKEDYGQINLVAEPNEEFRNISREWMKKYYLKKGDEKTARLFGYI